MILLKARVVASKDELAAWGIEALPDKNCFVLYDREMYSKTWSCVFRSFTRGHIVLTLPSEFVVVGDEKQEQVMNIIYASRNFEGQLIAPAEEVVRKIFEVLEEE